MMKRYICCKLISLQIYASLLTGPQNLISLYKQLKMQREDHKQSLDQLPEPLVWLSDLSIAIYPHQIVQYPKTKNSLTSLSTPTLPTLKDLDQPNKVVSFLSGDVAFKIDDLSRKVTILKVQKQKIELQFALKQSAELATVQDILRKKMCEIGFEQKYTVLNELGKGATAKVYLVERKSDRQKFAAKIISLKTSDNRQYQSFINETKILRCLKNKHIVSIQSLYISKKELICVLEYLQGGTLLEELRNDMLKSKYDKCKAIRDITLGIEHMRQKRIVHRDLKLQNIMVRINQDSSKDYVITDFGLATWIGQKQLIFQKCGTPGYIAPEILRANRSKVIVSHSSDIFSLGVIIHFILLLRAVFPFNGNPKELLALNKKALFSLDTKYHMKLSDCEFLLLQRTLAIDPEKRCSSRQLLDLYIRDYEKETGSPRKVQKREQNTQRRSGHQSTSRCDRLQMGNSIETIEKRPTSLQRKQFSQRMRTEPSPRKQDERQSSVGKFLNKIWSRITMSKSEVMKQKEEPSVRKRQMKNYLF